MLNDGGTMTSSSTSENIKSHPPDGVSHSERVCILGKEACSHGKSGKDFEGQAKVMPKFWDPCTGI